MNILRGGSEDKSIKKIGILAPSWEWVEKVTNLKCDDVYRNGRYELTVSGENITDDFLVCNDAIATPIGINPEFGINPESGLYKVINGLLTNFWSNVKLITIRDLMSEVVLGYNVIREIEDVHPSREEISRGVIECSPDPFIFTDIALLARGYKVTERVVVNKSHQSYDYVCDVGNLQMLPNGYPLSGVWNWSIYPKSKLYFGLADYIPYDTLAKLIGGRDMTLTNAYGKIEICEELWNNVNELSKAVVLKYGDRVSGYLKGLIDAGDPGVSGLYSLIQSKEVSMFGFL